jgi:hypothetical protein
MEKPFDVVHARLQSKGCRPRRKGATLSARCPAHEDKRASLAVSVGEDGRVLICCHSGCSFDDVCRALDVQPRDCFPDGAAVEEHEQPTIRYPYRDERGSLLGHFVKRPGKAFAHERPNPDGGPPLPNWDGMPRVLYRLPELIAADPTEPVLIVEGEKDVDSARSKRGGQWVATCNPDGAGNWKTLADYSQLACRSAVIIADKDSAGRAHASDVAARLFHTVKEVRVLELPGKANDFTEWMEAGGARSELQQLIDRTPTLQAIALQYTQETQETQGTQESKETKESQEKHSDNVGEGTGNDEAKFISKVGSTLALVARILSERSTLVDDDIPASDRLLFTLARAMKGMCEQLGKWEGRAVSDTEALAVADAAVRCLFPNEPQPWEHAFGVDEDEAKSTFITSWESAFSSPGEHVLATAVREARALIPHVRTKYPMETYRLFLATLVVLVRKRRSNTPFIDCRSFAKALNCSFKQISNYRRMAEKEQKLRVLRIGSRAAHRSTEVEVDVAQVLGGDAAETLQPQPVAA